MFTVKPVMNVCSSFGDLGRGPGGVQDTCSPSPAPHLSKCLTSSFLPVSCGPHTPQLVHKSCLSTCCSFLMSCSPVPYLTLISRGLGRPPVEFLPLLLGSHPSWVRSKLLLRSSGVPAFSPHLCPQPLSAPPTAHSSENLPLGSGSCLCSQQDGPCDP